MAEFEIKIGERGPYRWLITPTHDFDTLLSVCPGVVLGKYIAVTSFDSGCLYLGDSEKADGWKSRKGVAYSSVIKSVDSLPQRGGWDEWYVFDTPTDLGQLDRGNIFESSLERGQIFALVNYGQGFVSGLRNQESPATEFWKQMEWIAAESFIADDCENLIFVSKNATIFESALLALALAD